MIKNIKKIVGSIGLLFMIIPLIISATPMQSANYKIESDSINVGGSRAISANYIIEDTTGEIATGESASASHILRAGFQQMQETYISITVAPDITMTNMAGIGAVSSTGETAWTVLTDNNAGYELSVRASSNPTLQSTEGYSFDDYSLSGADPDYIFSIPATSSAFAFTPEGADIHVLYQDNGTSCNVSGSDTIDRCWAPFLTNFTVIAGSAVSNHPIGTSTTLKVRAENGVDHIQEAGTYTATLIVTAIAL